MKRIIKRLKFLKDKEAEELAKAQEKLGKIQGSAASLASGIQMKPLGKSSPSYGAGAEESTPLNASDAEQYSSTTERDWKKKEIDENMDFFPFLMKEVDKINKFFVGKLAELRINLELITSKRANTYISHHTSGETDLFRLRDVYVDLAALRSFCDLNQTGTYSYYVCPPPPLPPTPSSHPFLPPLPQARPAPRFLFLILMCLFSFL